MAEEVKQVSFPDTTGGIEYARYTVEGSSRRDRMTCRSREHARRRNQRRALRPAQSVHAHSEIAEAGWFLRSTVDA